MMRWGVCENVNHEHLKIIYITYWVELMIQYLPMFKQSCTLSHNIIIKMSNFEWWCVCP